MIYVLVIMAAFCGMELVAWAAHKYVMHGWLWHLHQDHHTGGYHPFQKNDWFFLIFALPCMFSMMFGGLFHLNWLMAAGIGIFLYGWCYFLVHDVIIHRRFKWFAKSNNRYIKVIRWAHKMHHKHTEKENGESFGLLVVPIKYWQKVLQEEKRQP